MDLSAPTSALSAPIAPLGQKTRAAATHAAREFEAMMITQMLEPMWAGIKTDGQFGGGTGEQIFRSLMMQETGRMISAQGGIGLAQPIARELLAMQEKR